LLGFVMLVAGCEQDPAPVSEVEIRVSEQVPTVITVRWEPTVPPEDVVVEVGEDGAFDRRFAMQALSGGGFVAQVLGLKPARQYDVRLSVRSDGSWLPGESRTVWTGAVPSAFPEIAVQGELEGYVATAVIQAPSIAALIDGDGDYVWWHRVGDGDVPWSHAVINRFALTRDGTRACYLAWTPLFPGADFMAERDLVCMSLDGEVVDFVGVEGAHHDFAELDDGSFAVLSHEPFGVNGDDVIGDRLLKVDGEQQPVVWSLWDHHEIDPDEVIGHNMDYSHGNALQCDDIEDVCYISMRYFDSIVKVDLATGEELWHLGGEDSDFKFEDGEQPTNQHQFQLLDDGILVFDNGEDGIGESRAVEYGLDETAGTADKVWEYHPNPPLAVYSLGDVQRLDDGDTLITWSTSGLMERVDPDGEVLWSAALDLGSGFGYSRWVAGVPGEI